MQTIRNLVFLGLMALLLSSCATVENTYNITGDGNTVDGKGSVTSPREVSTSATARDVAGTGVMK